MPKASDGDDAKQSKKKAAAVTAVVKRILNSNET